MMVAVNKNRGWIRENNEKYEIDLTIDSGAVTTIAPPNTIPDDCREKLRHPEEESNTE